VEAAWPARLTGRMLGDIDLAQALAETPVLVITVRAA